MSAESEDIVNSNKLGTLEGEVLSLKGEMSHLSITVDKIEDGIAKLADKIQPKQIGMPAIIAMMTGFFSLIALAFSMVIFIVNSAISPLQAQNTNTANILQSMQSNIQHNAAFTQLTNKEVSGLANKVSSNEETLRWLIFEENIPKQVSALTGEIETLKMQVDTITSFAHNPHKGK